MLPEAVYKDPSTFTAEEVRSYARGLVQLASLLAVYLGATAPTGEEDEEEERTEPGDPSPHDVRLGHLALRDYGLVLLSTEDCQERDLSGRKLLTFLVLCLDKVAIAHEAAQDAFAEGASRVVSTLPRKARNK